MIPPLKPSSTHPLSLDPVVVYEDQCLESFVSSFSQTVHFTKHEAVGVVAEVRANYGDLWTACSVLVILDLKKSNSSTTGDFCTRQSAENFGDSRAGPDRGVILRRVINSESVLMLSATSLLLLWGIIGSTSGLYDIHSVMTSFFRRFGPNHGE